jgi:hypothetical protein
MRASFRDENTVSFSNSSRSLALVRSLGDDEPGPCPSSLLTAFPALHLQPFLSIKPPDLLQVHHGSLALQHLVQAAVSEPAALAWLEAASEQALEVASERVLTAASLMGALGEPE